MDKIKLQRLSYKEEFYFLLMKMFQMEKWVGVNYPYYDWIDNCALVKLLLFIKNRRVTYLKLPL